MSERAKAEAATVERKRGTRRGDPHYRAPMPSKLNRAMREVVRAASELAGDEIAKQKVKALRKAGVKNPRTQVQRGELGYLVNLALTEPRAFSAILGRTVEKEVNVKHDVAGPLVIFRDYTNLKLEKLPPAILRRIEKESTHE